MPWCTRGKGKTRSYPCVDARVSLPPRWRGGERSWRKSRPNGTRLVKLCRREIDSSICHGRDLCTRCKQVCALFTCFPKISFASHSRAFRLRAPIVHETRLETTLETNDTKTYTPSQTYVLVLRSRLRAFN